MARLLLASSVLVAAATAPVHANPDEAPAGPSVTFSGFVDTSLSTYLTPDAAREQGVLLGLDQLELDVDVAVSPGLRLRGDLQFFPQLGVDTSEGAVVVFDQIVEQAFAEWFVEGGDRGFILRLGKWNAPVGFETIDPTGLWQFSQGLLFVRATPANLTGFALGWVGESTSAQLWLTNDWDTPGTPKDASVGGRVQQAVSDVGTIGLSATYGALADDPGRLMIDLDLAFTFDALRLGGQLNFGMQDDLTSLGFLVSANYAFTDAFSLTARVDWLDRELLDGPYKGMSLTLAGLVNLTKGLDLIAEVRADLPDGGDTSVLAALELLASF
ncbi:MAG: outer membrane beta-barrel protein [Deltaproteobacteria bacterium]|nr:outer membrane beta-barrel protein [Deltaproteobacteria bacterium]